MSLLNQKEYLKKYLGIGKDPGEKRKKKKKEKTLGNRLRVVDEDLDVAITQEIQDDIAAANEDAPQIVAVIDDRPPSLRIDEETKSKLWKPIGEPSEDIGKKFSMKLGSNFKFNKVNTGSILKSKLYKQSEKSTSTLKTGPKVYRNSSRDVSPQRKNIGSISSADENSSLEVLKRNKNVVDSAPTRSFKRDYSPTRRNRETDNSPPRKIKIESTSPPRQCRDSDISPRKNSDVCVKNLNRDRSTCKITDDSPTRKIKKEEFSPQRNVDSDISPPRLKTYKGISDDDNSSQKRNKYFSSRINRIADDSSPRGTNKDTDNLSPRRRRDSDISCERSINIDHSPSRRKTDYSPPTNIKADDLSPLRRNGGSDIRPPRLDRNTLRKDEDNSPPRRNKDISPHKSSDNQNRRETDNDMSPPRKNKYRNILSSSRSIDDLDISPPRRKARTNISYHRKPERDRSRSPRIDTQQTLSNDNSKKERNSSSSATAIKKKVTEKERKSRWGETEDRLEKTLSGKKAGLQDAKSITLELTVLKEKEDEMFRNLSEEVSGANATTIVRSQKPRDFEEESRQKIKEKDMKEKYDRWGKGIKQVDEHNQQLADQLHEMSKPLARYADDEDLEKYLKEQEREGDPMLAYIRKKRRKKAVEIGIPEKPQYMGEFMPNRFGITPGYRWDGVDRSNGYERKWFETQNKKRAIQEEAHKWSTEDM